ncbi:MAG: Asp-tRNA(Asn)/Glu-tRNA(Gln) amidotransferase subunit GatA [Bdellovibrionales bacterium]|nr:Asp-tRNA(Asn)/Glu-tRNA(Gln) amidotransferase subunit GatA [Bdellovibrionales bacterium]
MSDLILESSIEQLHQKLKDKSISSTELTQIFLDQTKKLEPSLGSFLHVDEEHALSMARAADQKISEDGKPSTPLHGIPIAVKDIIVTKGIKTTAASQILKDFIPIYESTATQRLWNDGAVLLGKTNLDEFAMGSSTENSSYHVTKNPWNLSCVPGGSSGGSATCVSARQVPMSLGTDTGGSIRQPAALCGIVGLKPSYGRVSRYGSIAFSSSLDQIGPMTKTVKDAAYVLESISGIDELDSTSEDQNFSVNNINWRRNLEGVRIGVPQEYLPESLDASIRENFELQLEALRKLGAEIEMTSLPYTEYGLSCYYILAPAEASSNLARFDGIHYTSRWGESGGLSEIFVQSRSQGFGAEVKRRIMLGTYVLSSGYYDAYYKKALQVRNLIRQDFDRAFSSYDFLLTPTSPCEAFELGSKSKDPLTMYLSDVFTVCISLAGLPAVSVPCGMGKQGLPLGLQFIGKYMDEAKLLSVAHAFEQEHSFYQQRPSC